MAKIIGRTAEIERKDNVVNMCEMKFYNDENVVTMDALFDNGRNNPCVKSISAQQRTSSGLPGMTSSLLSGSSSREEEIAKNGKRLITDEPRCRLPGGWQGLGPQLSARGLGLMLRNRLHRQYPRL